MTTLQHVANLLKLCRYLLDHDKLTADQRELLEQIIERGCRLLDQTESGPDA